MKILYIKDGYAVEVTRIQAYDLSDAEWGRVLHGEIVDANWASSDDENAGYYVKES